MSILKTDRFEIRQFQQDIINEVVNSGKSIGLVLPTATGKTPMAIWVADHYYQQGKVLFLVPNTQLGQQHYQSVLAFTTLTENEVGWMSGAISAEKRQVLWPKYSFVIATPQTVWNDIQSGIWRLDDYSLIIFDEMHLAGDNYDYVFIADLAKTKGIVRLGLTASPGGAETKIHRIQASLGVEQWIVRTEFDSALKKYTFPKIEKTMKIELTDDQRRYVTLIEKRLEEIFLELAGKQIVSLPLRILSIKDLEKASAKVNPVHSAQRDGSNNHHLFSLVTEYFKLRYLYTLIVTENLEAAWHYLQELRHEAWPHLVRKPSKAKSPPRRVKSSHRICMNDDLVPIWREIKAKALAGKDDHPKLMALLTLLKGFQSQNRRAIVFCNDKNAQSGILKAIDRDTVLAGQARMIFSKSTKQGKQENASLIDRFVRGEYRVLISTSILEAGVHLPEVDVVVNYSIPLEENTMIQRRGRVGRTKIGYIYYLAMDHELDNTLLYSNFAKVTRMQALLSPASGEQFSGAKQIELL
jgi:Fanconi anemia group M protein